MRKFAWSLLLVCSFLLAGCAAPHVMVLKDGTTIETVNAPEFDNKTGFYEFETTDGKMTQINKDEVVSIKEK